MLHLGRRVLTLWLAITLVFFALRVLPGDAVLAQFEQGDVSEATIQQRRVDFGLDQPLAAQYGVFMAALLRGDLGRSYYTGQPVTEMIAQRIPPTLTLTIGAMLVALIAGTGLGIAAGGVVGRWAARLSWLGITLLLSIPIFWLAIIGVLAFSVWLNWLPSSGIGSPAHLLLPMVILGLYSSAPIAALLQASVRETANAPYIQTARGKGLPERRVLLTHMLRVGLIPTVSAVALQVGFLLGGTVMIETLFLRPGLGRLLLDAVTRRDFPVVQGVVLLSALIYVTVNTLADLIYPLLDPRLRARPFRDIHLA